MVIPRFSFEEKSNARLGKLLEKLLKLNIGCYLCPGMWELLPSSNPINVGQTSVLFYENSPLRCSNGVRGGRENLNVTRLCFCKEASARVSFNTHSKKKQPFLMLLCLSKKEWKGVCGYYTQPIVQVRLFANYVFMRRPIIRMDLSSSTKIEISKVWMFV